MVLQLRLHLILSNLMVWRPSYDWFCVFRGTVLEALWVKLEFKNGPRSSMEASFVMVILGEEIGLAKEGVGGGQRGNSPGQRGNRLGQRGNAPSRFAHFDSGQNVRFSA